MCSRRCAATLQCGHASRGCFTHLPHHLSLRPTDMHTSSQNVPPCFPTMERRLAVLSPTPPSRIEPESLLGLGPSESKDGSKGQGVATNCTTPTVRGEMFRLRLWCTLPVTSRRALSLGYLGGRGRNPNGPVELDSMHATPHV